MRILYAFLILFVSIILFTLPISEAVYDYRTDLQEDSFYVATGSGVTTATATLSTALYDDDTATISLYSDTSTDTPTFTSYNGTSRVMALSGLTANTTRTLAVSYDIDVLNAADAVDNLLSNWQWYWYIIISVFPIAALAAIFTRRA